MSSTVIVTDNNDNDVYFKVNNTTKLSYVWNAYTQREGVKVLFTFNGDLIPKEYYEYSVVNLGMSKLGIRQAYVR